MNNISWILSYRTDGLTVFFKCFPYLVSENFLLFFIALGFWIWKKEYFRHFTYLICITTLLNAGLKAFFQIPRPNIEQLVSVKESIFSFPSGDVQAVTVFWLMLAMEFKKKGLWIATSVIILLTACSRVYLGVHYPIDTLGGFLIGLSTVMLYYYFVENLIHKKIFSNLFNSMLLGYISLGIYYLLMHNNITLLTVAGGEVFAGVMLGNYLEATYLNFEVPSRKEDKIIFAIIGVISILFYKQIMTLIKIKEMPTSVVFLSYVALGVTIIYFVPLIRTRIKFRFAMNA